MYTSQEIVNKIWDRLNDGKGQAGRQGPHGLICEYETTGGNRCAVGIFMPETHAALSYEGDVYALMMDYAGDTEIGWMEPFQNLLSSFQEVHDEKLNWTGTIFNERGREEFKSKCHNAALDFPGDIDNPK